MWERFTTEGEGFGEELLAQVEETQEVRGTDSEESKRWIQSGTQDDLNGPSSKKTDGGGKREDRGGVMA